MLSDAYLECIQVCGSSDSGYKNAGRSTTLGYFLYSKAVGYRESACVGFRVDLHAERLNGSGWRHRNAPSTGVVFCRGQEQIYGVGCEARRGCATNRDGKAVGGSRLFRKVASLTVPVSLSTLMDFPQRVGMPRLCPHEYQPSDGKECTDVGCEDVCESYSCI